MDLTKKLEEIKMVKNQPGLVRDLTNFYDKYYYSFIDNFYKNEKHYFYAISIGNVKKEHNEIVDILIKISMELIQFYHISSNYEKCISILDFIKRIGITKNTIFNSKMGPE
jgi:hypothetical protein